MASQRSAAGMLRALLLCAGALLCLARPASAQYGPDSVEIRSIRFEGNRAFTELELRSAILATATHCRSAALLPFCWAGTLLDRQYFDPRLLAFDSIRVRLFYFQHGYREAKVALDTSRVGPRAVQVRFRVREGRPVVIDTIRFAGVDSLPPSLVRGLPLAQGQPLDELAMEATRDTLRARLQDRGYFHADVLANYDIARSAPYSASVEYQVLPGALTRFGSVEVRGANRVDTTLILRSLDFRPGDLYSRAALLRSQRNLFALEVFRHAEITPLATVADSVLPVRVQVIEGYLHRFRFGFGVTTAEYLNAEGRWTGRNVLGGARRLDARARVANLAATPLKLVPGFDRCSGQYCDLSGSLTLDLTQPRFFDPLASLTVGLFVERVTVPQVYVRTSRGGYASVRRPFGATGAVSLGYRPELTQLESAEEVFCVSFTACEPSEIRVLSEPHRLAPLTLAYNLERANNLLSPTRGYALRTELEGAGTATGSEFAHLRGVAELVRYGEPLRGVVLATRLRSGWARALGAPGEGLGLHPQKRFFAGGPNSVRGFAQYRLGPKLLTVDAASVLAASADSLGAGCSPAAINAGQCDVSALAREHPGQLEVRPVGGTVLFEGNAELRFPLFLERFTAAAFLDFGQVWRSSTSVRPGELAWSPGIGVRYFSPIGPVRVDVGYNTAGTETLAVLSTDVCDAQTHCGPVVPGQTTRLANGTQLRAQPSIGWNPYRSFTDRLQIHFSIGQAF